MATISVSAVEGESLALLDSLRLGTPVLVVASDSSQALKSKFGEGVTVAPSIASIPTLVGSWGASASSLVRPPSWNEVAESVAGIYRAAVQPGNPASGPAVSETLP